VKQHEKSFQIGELFYGYCCPKTPRAIFAKIFAEIFVKSSDEMLALRVVQSEKH